MTVEREPCELVRYHFARGQDCCERRPKSAVPEGMTSEVYMLWCRFYILWSPALTRCVH